MCALLRHPIACGVKLHWHDQKRWTYLTTKVVPFAASGLASYLEVCTKNEELVLEQQSSLADEAVRRGQHNGRRDEDDNRNNVKHNNDGINICLCGGSGLRERRVTCALSREGAGTCPRSTTLATRL